MSTDNGVVEDPVFQSIDEQTNVSSSHTSNQQRSDKSTGAKICASAYRDKGFVPIFLNGKKPIEYKWQDFTPGNQTPEVIKMKSEKFKNNNLGILCYNHQVLDFDDLHTYIDWIVDYPEMQYTPTVATGRENSGRHVFLKISNPDEQKTRLVYFNGNKIELKGKSKTGGSAQTVAPPSIHPDTGKMYEFLPGKSFDEIEIMEVASLDEIGLTLNKKTICQKKTRNENYLSDNDESFEATINGKPFLWWKKSGERLITKTLENLENSREGERNSTLSTWAGRTFQRLNPDFWPDAYKLFFEKALSIGLEFLEIEATLNSAQDYARDKIKEYQEKTVHDDKNKTAKVIEILNSYWNFRRNVVTGRVEFKNKQELNFQNINDFHLNSILTYIRDVENIFINKSLLTETIESDFSPEFHPFKFAIDNLPVWDGKTDHIAILADKVTVKPDPEYEEINSKNCHKSDRKSKKWRQNFRRWLIGTIACMIEHGVNQLCLVLQGIQQGTGKTTFIDRLCLPELKKYIFRGYLNPRDKDARITISEKCLVNLDELEASTKGDWSFLKSLITMDNISLRRPYGHFNQELKRHASFAASINNKNFLDDATGSRRFLVVETSEIDYSFSDDLVINAYAQAKVLFQQGEKYWYDGEEIDVINQENEAFHVVVTEEELLLANFRPKTESELVDFKKISSDAYKKVFMTNTEILLYISERHAAHLSNISARRLGSVLEKNGFIRRMVDGRYRYAVEKT